MSGYDRVRAEVALEKHPTEEEIFTADFTDRLGARTISNVIGVTSEPAELVFLGIVVDSTAKKVQFKITSGFADKDYVVNVDITTNTTERLRGEGILRVRDRNP